MATTQTQSTQNPLTLIVDAEYAIEAVFEQIITPPAPAPIEPNTYTLSAQPTQINLVRGGPSAEFTIRINRSNFTGPVNLTTTQLTGIVKQLGTDFVEGDATTLRVQASTASPLGPRAISIYGTSLVAGNTSTAVIVNVTEAPPAPVTPPAPPPIAIPTWRSCIDGNLREGTPPNDFIQVPFPAGGTCWEPKFDIGFEPGLDSLRFNWRRGSKTYPDVKTFKVINPSNVLTFEIKLTTNPDVVLTVNGKETTRGGFAVFSLGPKSQQTVGVKVSDALLQKLADGTSTLEMNIEALES